MWRSLYSRSIRPAAAFVSARKRSRSSAKRRNCASTPKGRTLGRQPRWDRWATACATPSKGVSVIAFSHINKQYGKQVLFVDASFQLNPGEKVGLVGPNGSGKTTLFRMIVGEEAPDEGEVSVPKRLTIGYFRQDVEEMLGRSVLDEAIAGNKRLGALHHELEE